MTHIPYRGVPQAQQAVMTGEVAAFFDTPVTALPQIRAGTVRALGISTSKRLTIAPDIPTIAEAGVPGYEVVGWNGILAPANTPRPIIDKLNAAIQIALKTPEMVKLLTEQGIEPAGNSPEEFAPRCMPISKNGYGCAGKPASSRNRRELLLPLPVFRGARRSGARSGGSGAGLVFASATGGRRTPHPKLRRANFDPASRRNGRRGCAKSRST